GRLPPSYLTDRASVRERHSDKEGLRASLARLLREQPEVAAAVDAEVAAINADPDRLDALLERQNYRLAFWRTAGRELDYRRFFDIHTLAALRMEDEAVFVDTHELVISWLDRGVVDGLRIDHPDGLRDPEGYLRRLARAVSPSDGRGPLGRDQPADQPGHRRLRAPPPLPRLHPPRATRDAAGAHRRLPRLPHLRRAGGCSPGLRGAVARRRGPRRRGGQGGPGAPPRPRRRTVRLLRRHPPRPAPGGGGGRARRPLPAGHQPGDGQGRRGHDFLHLQPAHGAQRGR